MSGQDTSRPPTSPDVLTTRVAEDLVSILDYMSRVVAAANGGSAHYLGEKAGQLAEAAQRLEQRLARSAGARLDAGRLRHLVVEHGQGYLAGRVLFPRVVQERWRVCVEVPLSVPGRDELFAAVSAAVSAWEPANRDGWDSQIYAQPAAAEVGEEGGVVAGRLAARCGGS